MSDTIDLQAMGQAARAAFRQMGQASLASRNAAILTLAEAIAGGQAGLRAANQRDIAAGRASGLSDALIDRLTLTDQRLSGMVADLRALVAQPDPLGGEYDHRQLGATLRAYRKRVPLGVMGVIYESRPNVTIDVAALAIKTGNAAILRGGKETLASNRALMALVGDALVGAGLPVGAVQFIDSADRSLVRELLRLNDYVDLIIPRGGAGLHQFCRNNATMPVITGGIGIVHMFVDETADIDAALPVIYNAKVQRPSVCNALDTLLVHHRVAAQVLPRVVAALGDAGVRFRAEPRALALVDDGRVQPAGEGDFDTEWLSLVLGLKVVDGIDEAIAHINAHNTLHSDAILSATPEHIARFVNAVDSAGVFVNASTRFNDGGQLGLGAEVAVSTQRLHARGPMGLPELTTYKWVVEGAYDTRG